MLSYWELCSLIEYDIIIIGSGIVGLSAAAALKEQKPDLRVAVFERGLLPSGASTRNAGFACIGSLTEILEDLSTHAAEDVVSLVALRKTGLRRLRSRLGDDRIGYRENGSFELIHPKDISCIARLEEINELLRPVLGFDAYGLSDQRIGGFGFSRKETAHLIQNHGEGEIHTGKMMRALTEYCIALGVEIKTGVEVAHIEDGAKVELLAKDPVHQAEIRFKAAKVILCTNAFTRKLLPDLDIVPGRGQVLLTKPIPDLPFKGIFHFEKGFYYFREIDGRLLLGGGRNLDFKGEETTDFGANSHVRDALIEKLRTLILPGTEFEIAQWWTGIMAFGKAKFPIIRKCGHNIYAGARMGGMGVAIGSNAGDQLAAMVLNDY